MSALVHAQLTGLRTLRSTYALMVGVIGLVTLITGSDIAANAGNEGFTTPAKLQESLVTTVGILAAVACSLFAAAQISGEYRYGTSTQRALASPRRRRLLTTALITYGMFALVLGGAALAVGLAVAGPLVAAKDLSLGLSFAVLAAPVTAVVLLTLIGVSVGMLCRSQPAAILVLVGAFVAEKLLTLFIGDTAAHLPYGLLTPLLGLDGALISRGTAALALAGVTLGLGLFASVLVNRRDVT